MSGTEIRLKSQRESSRLVRALGLMLIVAVAAVFALALSGVVDPQAVRLRFSEPFAMTKSLAEEQLVSQVLGDVEEFAVLPAGKFTTRDGITRCRIDLPVRGTRDSGTLEAELTAVDGNWRWEWANLRLGDGEVYALPIDAIPTAPSS